MVKVERYACFVYSYQRISFSALSYYRSKWTTGWTVSVCNKPCHVFLASGEMVPWRNFSGLSEFEAILWSTVIDPPLYLVFENPQNPCYYGHCCYKSYFGFGWFFAESKLDATVFSDRAKKIF